MLEVVGGGFAEAGLCCVGSVEDGRLDRMSETLVKKNLLKLSARVEEFLHEGKERYPLLRSNSLLKVLKSCCWFVEREGKREE